MSHHQTTFELGVEALHGEPTRAYVAILDAATPRVLALPPGEVISIGRSHSCALHLDDPGASRLHVTLRYDGVDAVDLVDQGSRNGTLVNGARAEGTVRVATGSEIRIGGTRLWLVIRPPVTPAHESEHPPVEDADLLAYSPAMRRTVALADRTARTDATVLLLGETGSGKEVLARRIHRRSGRAAGPFVAVNCAAIPETLAESLLFGHEKGAFTGAHERQRGVFEQAHKGTLFLDEIGELSAVSQARLLRVMEDRAVTRIGGAQPLPVDVRIVAATNRDLDAMAARGAFRHDLLFRLDVVRLPIPALRERPEDVLPLAERFLAELAPGGKVRFSPLAERALLAHRCPGNVRELRNRIERAIAVREDDVLRETEFDTLAEGAAKGGSVGDLRHQLDDVERDAIVAALRACKGNQTRAAQKLGISRRTLLYRIERYGLKDVAQQARE